MKGHAGLHIHFPAYTSLQRESGGVVQSGSISRQEDFLFPRIQVAPRLTGTGRHSQELEFQPGRGRWSSPLHQASHVLTFMVTDTTRHDEGSLPVACWKGDQQQSLLSAGRNGLQGSGA